MDNQSMISYWRTLSSNPVKLLDSIIEHSNITHEFASLLDSVAPLVKEAHNGAVRKMSRLNFIAHLNYLVDRVHHPNHGTVLHSKFPNLSGC